MHQRLRALAACILTSHGPPTTRQVHGRIAGAQAPGWTCTYRAATGAHASAVFTSALEALKFAEQHVRLIGGPPGEWTRHGDTWLMSTPVGDYLVRQQSARKDPFDQGKGALLSDERSASPSDVAAANQVPTGNDEAG